MFFYLTQQCQDLHAGNSTVPTHLGVVSTKLFPEWPCHKPAYYSFSKSSFVFPQHLLSSASFLSLSLVLLSYFRPGKLPTTKTDCRSLARREAMMGPLELPPYTLQQPSSIAFATHKRRNGEMQDAALEEIWSVMSK